DDVVPMLEHLAEALDDVKHAMPGGSLNLVDTKAAVGDMEAQLSKAGQSPSQIAALRKAAGIPGETALGPIAVDKAPLARRALMRGQQFGAGLLNLGGDALSALGIADPSKVAAPTVSTGTFDFDQYAQLVQHLNALQAPAPKPTGGAGGAGGGGGSEELDKYLERLKEEKDEIGMTAGQMAYYKAVTMGATDAEAKHAAALATSIDLAKKAAEATKQNASALESLIKRTHEQLQATQIASKGGLTEKDVVLGEADRDGATAAQRRALATELDETAALKEQDAERKNIAQTLAAQTKATDDYIAKLNEELAAINAGTKVNAEHDRALKGASPTQRTQITDLESNLSDAEARKKTQDQAAKDNAKYAEQFQRDWHQALDGTLDDFSKFFENGIEGKKQSWQTFTDELLQTWINMLTKMEEQAISHKILELIASIGGPHTSGVLAGDFGGGGLGSVDAAPTVPVQHDGGIVGAAGGVSRALGLSTIAHAPRFHSGLMPGEFPAILQKGEAVLSRAQVAAAGGGGGGQGALTVHQEQHFHFQGIDGRDIERMLHEHKGTIAGITAEAVRTSFAFRQQLSGQRS
ncbi:MAG: hypothetical protein ACREND_17665, partial [Gemmatimonadaceae bacterium]